ncbi:hypothetical protein [Streptomyces pilosus]
MTPPPFDIPAPLAGPTVAALTIAWAFLMTVDWIRPHRHNQEQP